MHRQKNEITPGVAPDRVRDRQPCYRLESLN